MAGAGQGFEAARRAAAELTHELARAGLLGRDATEVPPALRPVVRLTRLSSTSRQVVLKALARDAELRAQVLGCLNPEQVDPYLRAVLEAPLDPASRLAELQDGDEEDDPASNPHDAGAPFDLEKESATDREGDAVEDRSSAGGAMPEPESRDIRTAVSLTEGGVTENVSIRRLKSRLERVERQLIQVKEAEADIQTELRRLIRRVSAREQHDQQLQTTLAEISDALSRGVPNPQPPGASPLGEEALRGLLAELATQERGLVELAERVTQLEERRSLDRSSMGSVIQRLRDLADDLDRWLESPASETSRKSDVDSAGPADPSSRSAATGSCRASDMRDATGRAVDPRKWPALPPGVFDDSPEAARHYLHRPYTEVLVDGYNVTLNWRPDLSLTEQRTWLTDALSELAMRYCLAVTVVFDGVQDTSQSTPTARSSDVRVVFSPQSTEADDLIISMVRERARERDVVVISTDKRVRDGAGRYGAAVLSSQALLAELRRSPLEGR
jgi:predicted RNA-binding protein with PIN domain/uncharacterized coiled-coil protein SlyX